MSGIRLISEDKTYLTREEVEHVRDQTTCYGIPVVQDPLAEKILLSLLETMGEMKKELIRLRESNERMEQTLRGVVGQSHGTNVLRIQKMS